MAIRRYYSTGDLIRDMFNGFDEMFPTKTYSFKGEFIDTSKFDVTPKRSYLQEELNRKEEELKRIEEIHKITVKQRQDDIDSLRKKLTNK